MKSLIYFFCALFAVFLPPGSYAKPHWHSDLGSALSAAKTGNRWCIVAIVGQDKTSMKLRNSIYADPNLQGLLSKSSVGVLVGTSDGAKLLVRETLSAPAMVVLYPNGSTRGKARFHTASQLYKYSSLAISNPNALARLVNSRKTARSSKSNPYPGIIDQKTFDKLNDFKFPGQAIGDSKKFKDWSSKMKRDRMTRQAEQQRAIDDLRKRQSNFR